MKKRTRSEPKTVSELPGSGYEPSSGINEPVTKRTRLEFLDLYFTKLEALTKRRAAKECQLRSLGLRDQKRFRKAISKEINNNLGSRAYRFLSVDESEEVRKNKPEKIMDSRYVLNKKPLEPADVPKAEAEDLLLDDKELGDAKAKA